MLERFKRRSLAGGRLRQDDSAFPVAPSFPPAVVVYALDASGLSVRRYEAPQACGLEPQPGRILWVRVVGLHDENLAREVGLRFGLHPLLLDDMLATGHRPELEDYDACLFMLLRLLGYDGQRKRVMAEQVGLALGEGFVLTFQEREANLWDDVALRLEKGTSKGLRRGLDYLVHGLIAAVLDNYVLTLGRLAEDIEEIEQTLLADSQGRALTEIYRIKREVLFLHRSLWPLREVLGRFVKTMSAEATSATALLWSDIQQDAYQVFDGVETLREMLSEMVGLSMTRAELRMNAVGQYLTLVATVFLPLNFLVGFYGMNFDNLPFKSEDWGVYALMGLMLVMAVGMTFYFYRKHWLSGSRDGQ